MQQFALKRSTLYSFVILFVASWLAWSSYSAISVGEDSGASMYDTELLAGPISNPGGGG